MHDRGNDFETIKLCNVIILAPMVIEKEGRGTRNGYEASKGSKGISGL